MSVGTNIVFRHLCSALASSIPLFLCRALDAPVALFVSILGAALCQPFIFHASHQHGIAIPSPVVVALSRRCIPSHSAYMGWPLRNNLEIRRKVMRRGGGASSSNRAAIAARCGVLVEEGVDATWGYSCSYPVHYEPAETPV